MTDLRTTTAYARTAGAATSLTAMGHLLTVLAGVDDTGGEITAIKVTVRKGLEPPPHIHHVENEAFYIVDGLWRFTVGADEYEVGLADSCCCHAGCRTRSPWTPTAPERS